MSTGIDAEMLWRRDTSVEEQETEVKLERIAPDRVHLSRTMRTRFRGFSTIAITTGVAGLMRRGLNDFLANDYDIEIAPQGQKNRIVLNESVDRLEIRFRGCQCSLQPQEKTGFVSNFAAERIELGLIRSNDCDPT